MKKSFLLFLMLLFGAAFISSCTTSRTTKWRLDLPFGFALDTLKDEYKELFRIRSRGYETYLDAKDITSPTPREGFPYIPDSLLRVGGLDTIFVEVSLDREGNVVSALVNNEDPSVIEYAV